VERPRLPWWTLLPRKLLLAASPIILIAVVTTVVMFAARRVWRYPLFVIGTAILVGLGVGYSWWTPVTLLTALGIGCGLWAWQHPDSFTRTVLRQLRSEWRRAVLYAWRWRRVMLFTELTKRTGHGLHRVHYPTIRRVRADGGATGCPCGCCTASALTPTPHTLRSWRTPSVPRPAGSGWTNPAGSGWT
jgi:S-DNA-T family DNA segregation ATPase FtsK/SpoIIIE